MFAILVAATLAGVLAAPAAAETGDVRETTTYTIPGDQVFPEGVAFDRRTRNFYVGSTTDGTIFRGHLGRGSLEEFLPGGADNRTTAIGMKVDANGRLYVAGGATGQMWVYDTRTGKLIRRFDTGLREGTFINDVAFDRWGNAYFTDSMHPVLWRVPVAALSGDGGEPGTPDAFLDFTGSPAEYGPGFNLNGIVPVAGGRQLLAVASNTGKLFRIDIEDKSVVEVPVTGGELVAGDGMQRLGSRLFVVRNQFELVSTVWLSDGALVSEYTDPAFAFPTTAAVAGSRLLVVNAQFDRRESGDPELPFTVASVPLSRLLG